MFLFCSDEVNYRKRAMSHRQTRMERADEGSFPYWVAIIEEKCVGANFHVHQDFVGPIACLCPNTVPLWSGNMNGTRCFVSAVQKNIDRFMKELGGERLHPSEKGKGKNWAQWRKGSHKP